METSAQDCQFGMFIYISMYIYFINQFYAVNLMLFIVFNHHIECLLSMHINCPTPCNFTNDIKHNINADVCLLDQF